MKKITLFGILLVLISSLFIGCKKTYEEDAVELSKYNELVNNYNSLLKDKDLWKKRYEEFYTNYYKQESILKKADLSSENCYGNTIKLCPNCDYWLDCDNSNSMNNIFNCKNILTFQECDDYRVSDIVRFNNPLKTSKFKVHRIWEINSSGIYTKGDMNPTPDKEPIERGDILGKLIKIEY